MTTRVVFVDKKKEPIVIEGTEEKPVRTPKPLGVWDHGDHAEVETAFREVKILYAGQTLSGDEAGLPKIESIAYTSPERRG